MDADFSEEDEEDVVSLGEEEGLLLLPPLALFGVVSPPNTSRHC